MNIHAFASIATVLFYILLKHFRQSTLESKQTVKQGSNLIYVLFIPLVIYAGSYLGIFHQTNTLPAALPLQVPVKSDSILSASYPASVSSIK
jgi:hypothetical protein